MTIRMGPVLRLASHQDGQWHVSALIVAERDDMLLHYAVGDDAAQTVHPETLLRHGTRHVLRYRMAIPLDDQNERIVTYRFSDASAEWSFRVPSASATRLRAAFVSCNGFSTRKDRRHHEEPFERWRDLRDRHETDTYGQFHVLIMGGDQVYADPIWENATEISKWADREGQRKWTAKFTEKMRNQADTFYFELYLRSWGRQSTAMRDALARIPTLMMWDDHDIFDGWGSEPEDQQTSPVYHGLYRIARRYFRLFQLHRAPDEPNPTAVCTTQNQSYALTIGDVGVLALDLRSERTRTQVMSPDSWEEVYAWLETCRGLNHMLVVSSVPVVHVDLSSLETVTSLVDPKDLDDDLRDHWLSDAHKQERLRLIHRLLSFAESHDTRVTILSGDIHVAALGLLHKSADSGPDACAESIYQIISSPMVHPTPPAVMRWFYDWKARGTEEVDLGITSRFVEFPASHDFYIASRNWAALDVDLSSRRRLWCNWHVEGRETPYRHAIYARSAAPWTRSDR